MPDVFKKTEIVAGMNFRMKTMPDLCSKSLAAESSQKLFNRKFDLVFISFFFTDCYYSLIHKLNVIIINLIISLII